MAEVFSAPPPVPPDPVQGAGKHSAGGGQPAPHCGRPLSQVRGRGVRGAASLPAAHYSDHVQFWSAATHRLAVSLVSGTWLPPCHGTTAGWTPCVPSWGGVGTPSRRVLWRKPSSGAGDLWRDGALPTCMQPPGMFAAWACTAALLQGHCSACVLCHQRIDVVRQLSVCAGCSTRRPSCKVGLALLQHKVASTANAAAAAAFALLSGLEASQAPPAGMRTVFHFAVVSQTYVQQEQLLHRDFSTLIVDAQYLKAYGACKQGVHTGGKAARWG